VRLVAAAEDLSQPERRHPTRRLGHEVDAEEPLPEREVRAVEERARRDAELVLARVALPARARVEPVQPLGLLAARALDAGGPAQRPEVEPAAMLERVEPRGRRRGE